MSYVYEPAERGVAQCERPVGAGAFVAIIGPGLQDDEHRNTLVEAAASMARELTAAKGPGGDDVVCGVDVVVLVTHHHDDHEGGAAALVEALWAAASEGPGPGAPFVEVAVYGGAQGRKFIDGELFGDLQVVRAPGHTHDSVAFLLERDGRRVLFSGDTVLGAGISFVAHPDGDLTAYLATLEVLAERNPGGAEAAASGGDVGSVSAPGRPEDADDPSGQCERAALAPGHGPVDPAVSAVIAQYSAHQAARLGEVRATLVGVESSVADDELVDVVVRAVYVDASLRPAVEAIVRAQLVYLGRL